MKRQSLRNARVDIMNMYLNDLIPIIEIAKKYKVTRQAVYKSLWRMGVDTSKEAQGSLEVSCTVCGTVFRRHRMRIRKQLNHFCSTDCYYAFLDAGNGQGPYIGNRHGQRIARTMVSEYYTLQNGQVVHHEDRNCLNNLLPNLRVFATQGDHTRHHRGFDVDPVWDGRNP